MEESTTKAVQQQQYARLDKLTVVDAVMGTGKTTWVIEKVKRDVNDKFIIVVPLVTEVERYADELGKSRAVFAPTDYDPEDTDIDTKTKWFERAVEEGTGCIITTHAMLARWNEECFNNILMHGYTLVLDEAVDLVSESHIAANDYDMLLSAGYIKEEKILSKDYLKSITGTSKAAEYVGEFSRFVKHAILRNLIKVDDSKYVKTIKPECFNSFKECFVLTYLFRGSQLDCWLQLYGFNVDHKELVRSCGGDDCEGEYDGSDYGELVLVDHPGSYTGKAYKDLITLIEEPKLNAIGNCVRSNHPFSNGWIDGLLSGKWKQIENNMNNLMYRRTKAFIKEVDGELMQHPANYFMWSAKEAYRVKFEKGMRYKQVPNEALEAFNKEREEADKVAGNCFVAHNQKATNKYAHKACLAYMTMPFPLVPIEGFFQRNGLILDRDTFHLSTLVQWVWRSRIRNDEKILLYIPSEPLRKLFKEWLSNE